MCDVVGLCLQESSILLGTLVQLSGHEPGGERLLSDDAVAAIGKLFVRILTCCRHRGAIEGCSIGFSIYCTELLSCVHKPLQNIPRHLQEQVELLPAELCVNASFVHRQTPTGYPLGKTLERQVQCTHT